MKLIQKIACKASVLIGAGLLAAVASPAFADAKVDAAARNVASAATEVNTVIAGMNNAAAAKAAQEKLKAALKKFYAADDAFGAAARQANPKNETEGKAFEAAMEIYQKANESVSDAKVKAMGRPDVAGELDAAIKATMPKTSPQSNYK